MTLLTTTFHLFTANLDSAVAKWLQSSKPLLLIAITAGLTSPLLKADSISPSSYETTIDVGGKVTVHKTLTITSQSSAPVDVFFLTDTTGSMGSAISSVKNGFSSLTTSLSAVASNVAFGVGEYKDVTDSYVYRLAQDITVNTAKVQTALNSLSAGGGGDGPEANLYGLQQAATTSSFRTGSQRFLVWVGDAPGHDPSNGVTLSTATQALLAAGAKTLAINVGNLNATGQASAITNATGGQLLSGGYTQAASIIQSALTASLFNYSLVALSVSAPEGLEVSFAPTSISGSFDRGTQRTFDFDVTFTGLKEGSYAFNIDGLVDGATVASEADNIVVGNVPEPSSWSLMAGGLLLVAASLLQRIRKARLSN